ncbi:phage late control D family protein [Testudinibacter sp. P27/CKL/0425]
MLDIADLTKTNHRTPLFKITVTSREGDSKDITSTVSDRLISLTLADNRGFNADQLDIEISDHDGALAFPPRGATLEAWIGWQDSGLVHKGKYTVDEIEYSGAPDKLMIRGRSADLMGTLTTKQERSFDNISISDLIAQLAKENGLKPLCGEPFGSQIIQHLDQTNESTINLLTRLAEQYDAIATVKNGYLMFIKAGGMKTASGEDLPTVTITKQLGDSYRFSLNEGENYTAVRAYWHNLDNGKKGEVVIDKNTEIQRKNMTTKKGKVSKQKKNVLVQTEPVETDANKMKTLRHVYQSEAKAITGAKAAFSKLQRGVASFSLTLANGNPDLMPELPAALVGFKDQIDSTDWIVTQVTHSISDSGYTGAVEFELKIES